MKINLSHYPILIFLFISTMLLLYASYDTDTKEMQRHFKKERIQDSGEKALAAIQPYYRPNNYGLPFGLHRRKYAKGETRDISGKFNFLIKLDWWALKTDYPQAQIIWYYEKEGQSYIRKPYCREGAKLDYRGNNLLDCKDRDELVPFKHDNENWNMLVPLKAEEKWKYWLIYGLISATCFGIFYYCFFQFMRFLQEGAMDRAFRPANVKRLRAIAIGCAVFPFVLFLGNLAFRLAFSEYFTGDIVLSTEAWLSFYKPWLLGVIFLCFYLSFSKGIKLQEEADLTV